MFSDSLLARYNSEQLLDWLQGGVDTELPGNGGPGCYDYRSLKVVIIDTALLLIIWLLAAWWAWKKLPRYSEEKTRYEVSPGRQVMLVALCLMLGTIVGFKLSSKQVIYLLQPCHLTTAFQIYLLAAPANKHTTTLFRVHLGFLNGAVLALLFPATDVYLLPFELEVFWIQHIMMIVAPLYLISLGSPYTCETLSDFSYCAMSSSMSVLFHILILQPISILSGINVNYTMCPPHSLPLFVSGPHYLLQAGWHLPLVMTISAKMVGILAPYLSPTKIPEEEIKSKLG